MGELGGLVVHEGDEGGDDQGGAAAGDGGELVAEGLSRTGGHDEEDVAAVGGGAADGLLIGAKAGVTEGLVEEGFEVHATGSVSHIVRFGTRKSEVVSWIHCSVRKRIYSRSGSLIRNLPRGLVNLINKDSWRCE